MAYLTSNELCKRLNSSKARYGVGNKQHRSYLKSLFLHPLKAQMAHQVYGMKMKLKNGN